MEFVYLSTRQSAWRAERKENKLQKNKCIASLVTGVYLAACHKQKMWIKGREGEEGAASVRGIRSASHQGSLPDQGLFCHIVLHQASCEMMEPNAEWVLGMRSKTTNRCFLIHYSLWFLGLSRNRDAVLSEVGSSGCQIWFGERAQQIAYGIWCCPILPSEQSTLVGGLGFPFLIIGKTFTKELFTLS